MSVLNKIAFFQNRRDEAPNQDLARELAENADSAGIREISENIFSKDKNIQSDCIKVLYEIGYIKPELIAAYAEDFIKLLKSRNNRIVWGSMIALSTIARIKADDIYNNIKAVYGAINDGSVITVDNGIKVLASVAAQNMEYNNTIFPYLIAHLENCRPKEVGQHAESIFAAVNELNKEEFINVLKDREMSLTDAQAARLRKLYKKLS